MKKLIGIEETPSESSDVKKMNEMQPLEVCVVVDGRYKGTIVMRTTNAISFEVMDLTDPRPNAYWNRASTIKVRPCKLDSITLKLG